MIRYRDTVTMAMWATVAACGAPSFPPSSSSPTTAQTKPHLVLLSPEIVSPHHGGFAQPTYRLVKSSEEWQALWNESESAHLHPYDASAQRAPEIDFNEHSLLVAAMGHRSSGCCSVEFVSIEEGPERMTVTVRLKEGGAGCLVLLEETHPVAIAMMPRTTKEADFDVVREIQKCD